VRVRADILERALHPPGRLTIVRRNHGVKLADDGWGTPALAFKNGKVTSKMAGPGRRCRCPQYRSQKINPAHPQTFTPTS